MYRALTRSGRVEGQMQVKPQVSEIGKDAK